MNLIESIKVALENVYIFEMAFKKRDLEAKIRNLQDKIAEHIILVKLYPQNSARQHWEHELLTWFSTVNRYTLDGKKKLSKERYFELLYKELFYNSDYIHMVIRDMLPMKKLKVPVDLNVDKLDHDIETYYKYVSELLSNSSEYHKFSLNL